MLRNKEKAELKQAIIDLVNNEHGRPIPPGIIVKKLLNQYKHIDNVRNLIYKHISDLINEKQFKQLPSKSIVLFNSKNNINVYTNAPIDNSQTLQGTISINSAGNGFIKLKDEKKAQYYVYKTNLNSALDGDTVEFSPMKKPSIGDLKDAVITKVISRGKDFYVGIFNLNKDGTYKISIDNQKIKMDVKLDDIHGLVNGQKILIQIKKFEKDIAYGSVSRVIGHTGDVGVDILSIVYDNGVEPEFPNNIIEYARNLKLDIDPYQRQIRKDLTNLPIVTIDPATSKDFDDAFYTKKLDGDKYFLSVSIADVSHYVRFKSELDEEALNRGCSIYLVDRVIPMLPHNLSDDLCSLNPNVERLALTCDMIINNVGAIQDIKVYPSIIKSHRRYSYDEVNAFYNKTDDLKNDPKDVKEMLLIALELHRVLDITKKKRGYINFDVPEPIIMVDKDCVPTEIKKHESGTAQRMIEDFMVAANEAVTIHANKEK
jgi:ribonuclease R